MRSAASLPACPSFAQFFAATHNGLTPLPWQERLANQVAERGWPKQIGVPTGLGKTTTIDIAVWALAAQADRPAAERTAQTRTWYVVNRRLLVDAASDHAEHLARLLSDPRGHQQTEWSATLAALRRRLLGIGGPVTFDGADGVTILETPLYVSRLRGGGQAGRRPPHPAQPAILCSTVPMYGSRLLFRGYGVSNRMWPIEAALAGADSLLLLDEAHISRPLEQLLETLPGADAPSAGALLPARGRLKPSTDSLLPAERLYPQMVSLTATGHPSSDRFDLDDADRAHPVVLQRLNASKPARLVTSTSKALASDITSGLIAELDAMSAEGMTSIAAVVFVNSPRTALAVGKEVSKRLKSAHSMVTLTGQFRPPEADAIRDRLLDAKAGAPSGRTDDGEERIPLIVIATQTLEVGADLDFDLLISELAGVRAITQRLGRLNRLGKRQHSRAVLVHVEDAADGKLYGTEPNALALRLGAMNQPFNLGPAVLADVLGDPHDITPPCPELLGAHLWEFAKTSLPPQGAAPPDPFFDGLSEQDRLVSVCWRSVPPEAGLPLTPTPSDLEFVDVPIDQVGGIEPKWRVSRDGSGAEVVDDDDLRPGDRVIIDVRAGHYGAAGWDRDSKLTVRDLSPIARRTLRLTPAACSNFLGPLGDDQRSILDSAKIAVAVGDDDEPVDVDAAEDERLAADIIEWLRNAPKPPEVLDSFWNVAQAIQPKIERDPDGGRPRLTWKVPRSRNEPRIDALDELSLVGADEDQRELTTHLESVGAMSELIATRLGLPAELIKAAGEAGRFHDLGKAHLGFQNWLGCGAAETLQAKSGATRARREGTATGWPRGARHELISVQLLDAADVKPDEADLVRHLVISHHGHGRPLCPTSSAAPAMIDGRIGRIDVVGARVDPSTPDWDQPERFRSLCERFGYWGLALLEAVLRQADHVVSKIDEVV